MARKKEEAAEDAFSAEDGGSEVRVYELAFHLDPELSETEAGKVYEAIKAAAGASVVAEGTLEKVPLAYTISRSETAGRRDFDSAYFGWVAYEADGEGHDAALASVKGNSKVVRYLDIRTTKEEAKHSAEMKELRQAPPEAALEPVSDTELDAALENAVV